jgi:hypothetical protein
MLTEEQVEEEIRFCKNMTARCVARQMLEDSLSCRIACEVFITLETSIKETL